MNHSICLPPTISNKMIAVAVMMAVLLVPPTLTIVPIAVLGSVTKMGRHAALIACLIRTQISQETLGSRRYTSSMSNYKILVNSLKVKKKEEKIKSRRIRRPQKYNKTREVLILDEGKIIKILSTQTKDSTIQTPIML